MYLKKIIYNENKMPIEIEVLCEKCGNSIFVSEKIENTFDKITSDYLKLKNGIQIKCLCGNVSDTDLITREDLPITKNDARLLPEYKPKSIQQNIPKCPICQSTNLSKISAVKKVAKIAAFGIFGMGDNGKTWKCNSCGSKF